MKSLSRSVELAVARALFRLPRGLQQSLSFRAPVRIDGQTLDPEMQLALAARQLLGGLTLRAETPEIARSRMRQEALKYVGVPAPVRAVRDLSIPGPAGSLGARHYSPDEPGGPHPLLVFFHGGGFVAGDLDTHDEPCRLLCRHAGVHVLAVDYRLAPEHRFPAAVDDARAAFRWAKEHAAELGADPERVGVGGDSAGGNLAAVVSLFTVREGEPSPTMQVLIYPAAERVTERPSMRLFANGFLLEKADAEWYDAQYTGGVREIAADPRVSPLLAPDLSGLCPALVFTAGFDPLRDEGEAYAAALAAAGSPATLRRFPGLVHGFINMAGVSPAAENALSEIGRAMRELHPAR